MRREPEPEPEPEPELEEALALIEQFGPWRLESLIAVGGLGEVWRGVREGTLQLAAVKRLHTHLARNDEALGQFAVEQRLTETLPRHANLVHAIEHGAVEGRPYIALDLAAGADLRRMLTPPATRDRVTPAGATIPQARALSIIRAGCDAAAHLHAHGWVHGDINPSNLIVDADRAVLIDLGVARRIGEAGAVRGTHAYMAPEQVRGEAWTPATDVFALGVTLWELVANKRLFHRGPPWLSMAAVVDEAAPALADRALDEIVQAALAKDPAHRIASASELALRLCN
ncbi:MAG: serine/threonine protein kinase [Deltaproteobacteria bacterium]|nr:serine/threonine protein kinase [Deltaproteobacteria bacterium]